MSLISCKLMCIANECTQICSCVFGATTPPPPSGAGPLHSWCSLDHTQRRTTVDRTPLNEWSARRRDLYLTTQETDIHATGGIWTHHLSRWAAADPRLRPRGRWDRHIYIYIYIYIKLNRKTRTHCATLMQSVRLSTVRRVRSCKCRHVTRFEVTPIAGLQRHYFQ